MQERIIQFSAQKDDVKFNASFKETVETPRQIRTYIELMDQVKVEMLEAIGGEKDA